MANDSIEQEIGVIKTDLAKLREDLEVLTKTMTETVTATAREAGERARAKGEESVAAVQHEIEERPLTSAAVAFGLGILVGKMLSR